MLHITNGESAAGSLRESGIGGTVLPWQDVLHEGPLPAELTLSEMSAVRVRFLAESGWERDALTRDFQARDQAFAAGLRQDEMVLWFEADLYDQLQLIQILHWLASQPRIPPVSLICIGEHPDIPRFIGLGQLSPRQLAELFPTRQAITSQQLSLGRSAWDALCAPTPLPLAGLLANHTVPLPYLGPALRRHLQELPWVEDGLSRTERQVIQAVEQGPASFHAVFTACPGVEERPFMGDTTLWSRMVALSLGPAPALLIPGLPRQAALATDQGRIPPMPIHLSHSGKAYLEQRLDYVRANGVDRWMGGVHLEGRTVRWRWDATVGSVREFPV
jgi:hypothetical protein